MQMPRTSQQNGFSMSQSLVLCLRNALDITIRQTIKMYYRLQLLEIRFILQMEWYITHHIRAQYVETTLHCTEMKYSICSVERVQKAVSGFTNPFSSSFEDNELYFCLLMVLLRQS